MSEMEIQELGEMQRKIAKVEEQVKRLQSSQRFVYGLEGCSINPRLFISFANSDHQLTEVIPHITKDVFELIENALHDRLHKLLKERNELIICTKQAKYTPIDILDKE